MKSKQIFDYLFSPPHRSSSAHRSMAGEWTDSGRASGANNGRSHRKSFDVAIGAEVRFEFNIYMPSDQYSAGGATGKQLRSGSSP